MDEDIAPITFDFDIREYNPNDIPEESGFLFGGDDRNLKDKMINASKLYGCGVEIEEVVPGRRVLVPASGKDCVTKLVYVGTIPAMLYEEQEKVFYFVMNTDVTVRITFWEKGMDETLVDKRKIKIFIPKC